MQKGINADGHCSKPQEKKVREKGGKGESGRMGPSQGH